MPLDPPSPLKDIHRHLMERQGPDLSRYKESYLTRRLFVRIRALKLKDLAEYARYLKRHPEEVGLLQRTLSIKVTGFFRNRSCFAFLRERVVPELLGRTGPRRTVEVWSAGCATGEEVYSLAALFAAARTGPRPLRVRILGTDVDERALERARGGVFPAAALLDGAPEDAVRLFVVREDGTAVPSDALRRMVAFDHESLLDRFERDDLDLIVCRNVLIYFSLEHQETILARFAEALGAGGYLVLGRVERLFGPARGLFEVTSARDRVYRRLPAGRKAPSAVAEGAACA
jgi:chemotaxis methyl-accepting protein methylase